MAIHEIKLAEIFDIMGVGVRRASAFLALGLRAKEDTAFQSAMLSHNFAIQFWPEPLPADLSENIRSEFSVWTIGNALRELDQYFAKFLDRLYPVLVCMKQDGKIPANLKELESKFEKDTNAANKLKLISTEFSLSTFAADHVASISKARNALTHNLGIVSDRHCNNDKCLILKWRGLTLITPTQEVTGPFKPIKVNAGDKLGVSFTDREKTFPLGNAVDLTPDELSEICLTFQIQTNQLHEAVVALVKDKGLAPKVS